VKCAEDLAKPEKKLKSSHSSESAVKSSYNNQAIRSSIFSVGSTESINVENERLYFASRWSLIAGRLPGRTDNEIKNHRNTYLSKKLKINEWQPKWSENLKSRPEFPSPVQNHVFKTIPVKTTAVSGALIPNGYSVDGKNDRSDQSLKPCDVKEISNS
jgi:hypothetical protein